MMVLVLVQIHFEYLIVDRDAFFNVAVVETTLEVPSAQTTTIFLEPAVSPGTPASRSHGPELLMLLME